MDGTIGFVSLNNINKTVDFYLPHLMIYIGLSFSFLYDKIFFKNWFSPPIETPYIKILKYIYTYILIFTLISYLNVAVTIQYISSLVITYIILSKINDSNKFINLITQIVLPYLLIIVFSISQTLYLPFIAIIIIIYTFILYKCGRLFFCLAALLFATKTFYVGPTIIGDAFHRSEHFIASFNILSGLFSVFPNIGYLEELPGVLISKIFNMLSFGLIEMSIASSRSLLSIILSPIIFWSMYKKSITTSILFLLILPVDRLSILIAIIYSIAIYSSYFRNNKFFIIIIGIFPMIILGLSPSYSLIPIFTIIGLYPFNNIRFKSIALILAIWFFILLAGSDIFINFIEVYRDFSKNYLIGFSTSAIGLPIRDQIFWPLYIFLTSLIMTGVINKKDNIHTKLLKIILIFIILNQLVSYGYGRIDPGFSRLLPLSVALIYMGNILNERYRFLTNWLLFFTLIFYSNINMPTHISSFSMNLDKSPIVQLDDANNLIVSNINKFSAGRKVINYSMEPSLSYFIDNSLPPPFTSPYVTLGVKPQNDVLSFIRNNNDAIIYLGHSFIIFDGIDARLRAPIVFKYLAEKYSYFSQDGNIYAVPNLTDDVSTTFNLFFNDMDIQKSSLFYSEHAKDLFKYREVLVDCTQYKPGKFKIWSEHNFIFAELNCGKNLIPEVFFWGSTQKIERIQ